MSCCLHRITTQTSPVFPFCVFALTRAATPDSVPGVVRGETPSASAVVRFVEGTRKGSKALG
jgi:hypothetical protein